jgi:hypothetical protein
VTARAESNSSPPHLAKLNDAAAVRQRCAMVHRWVADGRSPHFVLDESRLGAVAAYVADVTREVYPDLKIPYHSRWRHFSAGGDDRWGELAARSDADRLSFARSEGLAVASFDMFRAGAFSADPARPWRVDSVALANIDAATLARHFQVDAENPLVGLDARSALLRRLGKALADRADLFARAGARPGNLVDHCRNVARDGRIPASRLLTALLDGLSSIWPSGLTVRGYPVGDAGRHPAVRTSDATDQIVPFHKLSQWLAYSLIEPLEAAGLAVERLHELTALAEYRNGGLLVDLGAIRPRAPIDPLLRHDVGSELVVEWRALTVALMDPLVGLVRERLGLDSNFTMPQLLQGGSWSAGRKIARALRPPDGPPPIAVAADGTVF